MTRDLVTAVFCRYIRERRPLHSSGAVIDAVTKALAGKPSEISHPEMRAAFLAAMPTAEALMPALSVDKVEILLLDERRA